MINSLLNGYSSVSSYYLNQTNGTNSSSSTEKTEKRDYSELSTDQLTISVSAQGLADLLSGLSGTDQRPDGPPPGGRPPEGPPPEGDPGDAISLEVDAKLEAFNNLLMAKLEAAGIDTEQEINLAYDDDGNIVVTNDTEDKALIEAVLANDSELSESFKELTALSTMAAEMQDRFAQGPPPPPPNGTGEESQKASSSSSVASLYAANSTLASNSTVTALLQRLTAQLVS